jgi:hypothetical protein
LFRLFVISALILTVGAARPTPTPTPTPLPPENPAITVIARHEFVSWQAGVVNKDHYVKAASDTLTDDALTHMSQALSGLGALVRVEWYGNFNIIGAPPGVVGYSYRMICSNGAIFEQLMIEPDGKIDSINFLKKLPE